jgi:hypothetical protein
VEEAKVEKKLSKKEQKKKEQEEFDKALEETLGVKGKYACLMG